MKVGVTAKVDSDQLLLPKDRNDNEDIYKKSNKKSETKK
jgi:hypothetical protein